MLDSAGKRPAQPITRRRLALATLALAFLFALGFASSAQAYVYWTQEGSIGRADLDGQNPDQDFITGASDPVGVAVDGRHVYWANSANDSIGRADLDGQNPDQNFITGADGPYGV